MAIELKPPIAPARDKIGAAKFIAGIFGPRYELRLLLAGRPFHITWRKLCESFSWVRFWSPWFLKFTALKSPFAATRCYKFSLDRPRVRSQHQ
jgi:hypothetical protein